MCRKLGRAGGSQEGSRGRTPVAASCSSASLEQLKMGRDALKSIDGKDENRAMTMQNALDEGRSMGLTGGAET